MATAVTPRSAMAASRACRPAPPAWCARSGLGHAAAVVRPRVRVCDGADQPGAWPGGGEPGLHQVRRRGLAVGAGDADDPQPAARLAVDAVGDGAEDGAGVVDDADRQAGRGRLVAGRSGRSAPRRRPRATASADEPDAVRAGTREGPRTGRRAGPRRRPASHRDRRVGGAEPAATVAPTRSARALSGGAGSRAAPRGRGADPASVGVTGLRSPAGVPAAVQLAPSRARRTP